MKAAPELVAAEPKDIVVTACPDGPLLVRGAELVRDAEGRSHRVTRPVVAVCTCGKSARMPWCDDTHKVLGKKA
ncbi:MAG: CDGSH iron-sulfur domain-containing protein [Actinomycetota bacterium]|nr:CDGSH iron-sulfur domain-containing protein [Actinomycetota bacterium]